jgi:hypothetical protein
VARRGTLGKRGTSRKKIEYSKREFPSAAEPLTRGTIVALLEKRDRWSKVELQENSAVEGWVRNQFMTKV